MDEQETRTPRLTERFQEALTYASQLHQRQLRKGTAIPYVSHLLSVTALVLEDGGDEDEAIAALLHDAVEDAGGAPTREEIRRRFGDRVGRIVDGCTDAETLPKPPWRERKERHLAELLNASSEVRRVALADKIHNARSILADLRRDGDATWQRFKGGKDGTLWYYHEAARVFRSVGSTRMLEELERLVEEMDRLANQG